MLVRSCSPSANGKPQGRLVSTAIMIAAFVNKSGAAFVTVAFAGIRKVLLGSPCMICMRLSA